MYVVGRHSTTDSLSLSFLTLTNCMLLITHACKKEKEIEKKHTKIAYHPKCLRVWFGK